jgi:dihydroorotase
MIYKNGFICDKNRYEKKDIRVKDGKIINISDDIKPNKNEKVIDCKNKVIMPAIIDLNFSIKDNKLNVKNIGLVSKKANQNGFSKILLDSNCTPKIDNETIVEMIYTKKTLKNLENLSISCNAIKDDEKISEVSTLLNAGCEAIQLNSDTNSNNLLRICQYSVMKNRPIMIKCYNKSLTYDKVMSYGDISSNYGLNGVENIAFTSEVAKTLEIAKYTKAKIVIKEVSLSDSIKLISKAKKENKNIFNEVPILNLVLSDEKCKNYNTEAKVFPPLTNSNEIENLKKQLKNNKIDMLTSLSSEISNINKDLPFDEAKYGTDISKEYFALCYTKLVKEKIISLSKLSELISYNQAKVLNYDKNLGLIKKGYNSKIIIVDLNEKIEIENNLLKSLELYGNIEKVL